MKCNLIPTGTCWEDLSPDRLSVFRSHLKSCQTCRKRVYSEAPEQLLFELENEELPEDFWLGFWPSLEKKLEPAEEPPAAFYPVLRWAAVFLFVLILTLYSKTIHEPAPKALVNRISYEAPDSSRYPLVEDVQNPKVRYYIFQSEGKENIVMMFNPDMEL
jgi:hypothetical protein